MSRVTRESGVGLVPILAIVLVLAVAAFVVYRVWDAQTVKNDPTAVEQNANSEQITNDTQLQAADQALESTDVEGSDLHELESQMTY